MVLDHLLPSKMLRRGNVRVKLFKNSGSKKSKDLTSAMLSFSAKIV